VLSKILRSSSSVTEDNNGCAASWYLQMKIPSTLDIHLLSSSHVVLLNRHAIIQLVVVAIPIESHTGNRIASIS
jgi:hypothetical protein